MTEPEQSKQAETVETEEYEDEPRNPFDNPYFLPILIAGFSLWCGWDGFISEKFENDAFDLWFNRIAFLVLGALAAWLTLRARRESAQARGPE